MEISKAFDKYRKDNISALGPKRAIQLDRTVYAEGLRPERASVTYAVGGERAPPLLMPARHKADKLKT